MANAMRAAVTTEREPDQQEVEAAVARKIPIANLYHMLCYAWDFFELNDEVTVAKDTHRGYTELLTKVFHKRDQDILNVVKDMKLEEGESKFEDLTASVVPQAGIEFADFDFDLHLKKEYMGAESSKLVYQGKGKYDGAEFTFSGPVNLIKL